MYPNDVTAAEREARYQDWRRAYLRHLAEHAGWVVLDVYDAGYVDGAEADQGIGRELYIDSIVARLTGQQEGQQP